MAPQLHYIRREPSQGTDPTGERFPGVLTMHSEPKAFLSWVFY